MVGIDPNGAFAAASGPDSKITPFVKIYPDGTIAAIIKHFEGGQGTATGLSALIAEELNMTLQDITFETAPSDASQYANLFFGAQGTGGSSSIANSFVQYRTAAAAVREMVLTAAAQSWNVPVAALRLQDGIVSGAGAIRVNRRLCPVSGGFTSTTQTTAKGSVRMAGNRGRPEIPS